MLGSIKGIKILGLKPTMITSIQSLRIDELVISKAFRKLLVWNMAFGKNFKRRFFFLEDEANTKF